MLKQICHAVERTHVLSRRRANLPLVHSDLVTLSDEAQPLFADDLTAFDGFMLKPSKASNASRLYRHGFEFMPLKFGPALNGGDESNYHAARFTTGYLPLGFEVFHNRPDIYRPQARIIGSRRSEDYFSGAHIKKIFRAFLNVTTAQALDDVKALTPMADKGHTGALAELSLNFLGGETVDPSADRSVPSTATAPNDTFVAMIDVPNTFSRSQLEYFSRAEQSLFYDPSVTGLDYKWYEDPPNVGEPDSKGIYWGSLVGYFRR